MTDDAGILGKFTVSRGKDERGKYFSYYDSYDLNPYKGDYSKFNSKIEDISMGIGKPYEVYDRIYYTDNIERKNQMENYKTEIDKLNKIQEEYYKHENNFTTPDGMAWEDFKDLSSNNYHNIRELEDKKADLERSPAYNKVYYTDKELSELKILIKKKKILIHQLYKKNYQIEDINYINLLKKMELLMVYGEMKLKMLYQIIKLKINQNNYEL